MNKKGQMGLAQKTILGLIFFVSIALISSTLLAKAVLFSGSDLDSSFESAGFNATASNLTASLTALESASTNPNPLALSSFFLDPSGIFNALKAIPDSFNLIQNLMIVSLSGGNPILIQVIKFAVPALITLIFVFVFIYIFTRVPP